MVSPLAIAIKQFPCEERLQYVRLYSLGRRNLRGNMMEMYKVLHGVNRVNRGVYFSFHTTPGHP